jgi:hypothetical protein
MAVIEPKTEFPPAEPTANPFAPEPPVPTLTAYEPVETANEELYLNPPAPPPPPAILCPLLPPPPPPPATTSTAIVLELKPVGILNIPFEVNVCITLPPVFCMEFPPVA